jgi:hypothetical protein
VRTPTLVSDPLTDQLEADRTAAFDLLADIHDALGRCDAQIPRHLFARLRDILGYGKIPGVYYGGKFWPTVDGGSPLERLIAFQEARGRAVR